jgi:hypothetical protein
MGQSHEQSSADHQRYAEGTHHVSAFRDAAQCKESQPHGEGGERPALTVGAVTETETQNTERGGQPDQRPLDPIVGQPSHPDKWQEVMTAGISAQWTAQSVDVVAPILSSRRVIIVCPRVRRENRF